MMATKAYALIRKIEARIEFVKACESREGCKPCDDALASAQLSLMELRRELKELRRSANEMDHMLTALGS